MPRVRPKIEKRCPMCFLIKPLREFYSSEKYDGGYSAYCIPCTAIKNKEHRNRERDKRYQRADYKRNPEKFRARSKEVIRKMRAENPAKYRAKKFFDGKLVRASIAEDVTRQYIEALFRQTTHCQCCGRKLRLEYESKEERDYHADYSAPSIDRVDNNKGYTRSNIAIICWECNHRKTDLTLDDLEMMIRYIKKFQGSEGS